MRLIEGNKSNGTINGRRSRSPTQGDSGVIPIPTIKSVFPPTYPYHDVLKSAAQFAFPCPTNS